jgi:hypothetical protein
MITDWPPPPIQSPALHDPGFTSSLTYCLPIVLGQRTAGALWHYLCSYVSVPGPRVPTDPVPQWQLCPSWLWGGDERWGWSFGFITVSSAIVLD